MKIYSKAIFSSGIKHRPRFHLPFSGRVKGLCRALFFILLWGGSLPLWAQENFNPFTGQDYAARHYWLSTEMGFGNATQGAIGLNAEYAPGWRLGIEYRHSSDREFLAFFTGPEENFDAGHLLLGKLFRYRAWLVDVKLGLGMGQRRLPVNVLSTGFFGSDYDLTYDWEPSAIFSVEFGINLAVFRPALQIGYSHTQRMAGPFIGFSMGFGKFF